MAEIKVKQTGKKIEIREGENLLEALLGAGIFVDNPCSGKGICGKCKVRIVSGEVSGITASEERLLKAEERDQIILYGGSIGRCGDRIASEGAEA